MMKHKFPIPERIIRCIVMAAISLLLTFGMIFLCVYLTGGREAGNFTDIDKKIFIVLMTADAVLMIFYVIFIFAAARMLVIRKELMDKRRVRFGADGQTTVYHSCEDVWHDSYGGKRAIVHTRGKLMLVLIEKYESSIREWQPEAMGFYDSVQELEQSLRNEYGLELPSKPVDWEKEEQDIIRVSIEDEETEKISVSIEDGDV